MNCDQLNDFGVDSIDDSVVALHYLPIYAAVVLYDPTSRLRMRLKLLDATENLLRKTQRGNWRILLDVLQYSLKIVERPIRPD